MPRSLLARWLLALLLGLGLLAYFSVPYVDRQLAQWQYTNAQRQQRVLASSLEEVLPGLMARGKSARLDRYVERVATEQQLLGILLCRPDGTTLLRTAHVPAALGCRDGASMVSGASRVIAVRGAPMQLSVVDEKPAGGAPYRLELLQDRRAADRARYGMRDRLIAYGAVAVLLVAAAVALGAWLLLRRWAEALIRDIRGRRFLDDARSGRFSLPILSRVRQVLRELEQSQRLEIDYRENWTPLALRQVVREQLRSPQILVVSNREPYAHDYDGAGHVQVQVPASGMVTALEPVMRACSGTWIAHGSGAADRDTVDEHDHVRVPPDDPAYTLRRVWLSGEEEQGFYYGLANEGLWPLCHLAYVRPAFRAEDWEMYSAVNRKFADIVSQETNTSDPLILVQDYHFALLPGLLRPRHPQATILLFWHIPWPNAETFGVCPWKEEMLQQLLMADILGFHTLQHCQNFLATVDRFTECQLDREHLTVTLRGHVCRVAAYPISIEWPPQVMAKLPPVEVSHQSVRERFGIGQEVRLGLGVERWDFTKGVLERLLAFELLLAQHTELHGTVTLLQVLSPSRAKLPAYQALQRSTLAEVERINARFGNPQWQPIVLAAKHHSAEQVFELYRAADFCIVNSLHDGMNLVAKEFVAARDDQDGVLILSSFAGASRELPEALLVNPFDVAETAGAMYLALQMPREQRRERMQLMRRTVKEHNVYRWAGRMLMDAARIRQRQALTREDPPQSEPGPGRGAPVRDVAAR